MVFFLYFLFVHISLLLPGYVFITRTRFLKTHPGIELSIGYLISIAIFALLALISYILKFDELIFQTIFWLIFFSSCVIFIYKKIYKQLFLSWFPLTCFFLATFFSFLFIGLSYNGTNKYIPDPELRNDRNYDTLSVEVLNIAQTNANDNYIPYRQAQFVVNRSDPAKDSFIDEWGVHFFQRTPLMGAVTAEYFIASNDSPPIGYTWASDAVDSQNTYTKFQIIAQILNALFIIPAFYLLKRLFDKRTAALALLFIVPSQFFLYNAFFSWPKSLVAFFILLSWLLILEGRFRFVLLAGAASGLAYLTHDLAVLYIGATLLLLLVQKRIRDTIVLGAVFVLFALPWLITSSLLYKKPSSFYLYPLSIHDIPQPEEKEKIIQEFKDTSFFRILQIRLESLFYLLSPYQAIYSESGQEAGRRFWALGLFSVPGAVGIGLIVPMVLGVIKQIKNYAFWILTLMPIILSTIVIGWPKGLGALHFAEASIVLLIGLACSWLVRARHVVWSMLAYLLCTAQLIIFLLYSYRDNTYSWLGSFKDICLLASMGLIVIACLIGIYFLNSKSKLSNRYL